MGPSDSTSGLKMAGMVLMLMIGYQADAMVMGTVPGPPNAPTPKHGGCLSSKKHMPSLIKTTIESLEDGARKVYVP